MDTFEWNKVLIFELIKLFQEKPELWDTSQEDYKNRAKKQEAWAEIAGAMNIDVGMLQRKMKMLINQYRRELFRKNSSSKWFAFRRMSFLTTLQPTNKQRQTCFVSVNREEMPNPKRKHKAQDEEQIKEKIYKGEYNHLTEKEIETRERDEYTTYGELIAMKLRKIEDSYARSTAQYHINTIMYKAEIGDYNKSRGSSTPLRRDSNDDDRSQKSSSSEESIDFCKLENENLDD